MRGLLRVWWVTAALYSNSSASVTSPPAFSLAWIKSYAYRESCPSASVRIKKQTLTPNSFLIPLIVSSRSKISPWNLALMATLEVDSAPAFAAVPACNIADQRKKFIRVVITGT